MNTSAARRTLALAGTLGLAADLLLRDGPAGVAFPIWIALLAIGAVALVRSQRRALPAEASLWMSAALLCAVGLAWRHSEELLGVDLIATGVCLAMTAVTLRDPTWRLADARVRDALWGLVQVARTTAAGIIPVALRARIDAHAASGRRYDARTLARAVTLSTLLLLVFGLLLLSADPIFASLVAPPTIDVALVASHVVLTGFFAWVVAGWSRATLDDSPPARLPAPLGVTLGSLDITLSLGLLNALFVGFVGAQLAWFFGGEAYLQSRTGLTASAYARRGFFELVWVALLVVPLLLGTRAAIGDAPAIRRRHTVLALPLIALVGAMILSAVLRMRLYVHYFGLTRDRFYPLVFMGWLVLVLALVAYSIARDASRRFLAGATLTGFACLAAVNVVNPDVFIARVNIERSAGSDAPGAAPLDLVHLATLGGDAAALAANAVEAATTVDATERCRAARRLLTRWGPQSARARQRAEPGGWRMWNAGEQRGFAAIASASDRLQSIIQATCTGDTGDREATDR